MIYLFLYDQRDYGFSLLAVQAKDEAEARLRAKPFFPKTGNFDVARLVDFGPYVSYRYEE